MPHFLPVSAIIPTLNRAQPLARTLQSLALQSAQPSEIIVVDSSANGESAQIVAKHPEAFSCGGKIIWQRAARAGAAPQRNQGVARATHPFICFFDDDVIFQPHCVEQLWNAIKSDQRLGGVNAMIVNQRYQTPGFVSRAVFTLMNGRRAKTFAGKVIGPAINLLPEDLDDLPEVVPVEWLNLGCTMYRREALPDPPFDAFFTGYSLMEDVTLSQRVAQRGWKLANVRTARIFHDSQPSSHKLDVVAAATMELLNRHYVMTQVLERRKSIDYLRLLGWEIFSILSTTTTPRGKRNLAFVVKGKWKALRELRNNS
jgi:GT2 family glycosyltransferase